jgi:hypothetical protein
MFSRIRLASLCTTLLRDVIYDTRNEHIGKNPEIHRGLVKCGVVHRQTGTTRTYNKRDRMLRVHDSQG